MRLRTFLLINAIIPTLVGCFALTAPHVLLESVKHATPNGAANVMGRTVGVLLITIGTLNFLVRNHEDSPTLRAVLIANLVLQIGIMPIDPLAYASGVFATFGSFVPNTILHILLASGLALFLVKLRRASHEAHHARFGAEPTSLARKTSAAGR